MSRPDRTLRVIHALGRRISDQGDMHIRVSRHTLRLIMNTLGFERWEQSDDFREFDAVALNMLQELALRAVLA